MVSVFGWLFVGIGTLILVLIGLVLWPLSLVLERANGHLPHRISKFWAKMITVVLPFWEIHAEGFERIEKNKTYVVISNHQSLLDILLCLAKLPFHFKFIAKRELFWIPFFGWHLWLARYISLNRGDPESGRLCILKARQWLRLGVSVIFFPEGTRSRDGQIHEFKAGAFKVALEEKIDILPVVIAGTRDAIPKNTWLVQKRAPLRLKILPPVSVSGYSLERLEGLRDEIRSQIIREFDKLKEEIHA